MSAFVFLMVLVGRFTLAEALAQVGYEKDMPVYDASFRPSYLVVTQKGEKYLRESPQEQAWLFSRLGVSARRHTGIWESLMLALENAFLRGNGADSKLEVIVRVYEGLSGKVVRIIDSGNGFDYDDIVRKMDADENYAQGRGKGLRVINASSVIAGYEGRGNVMNIAVMNRDLE
jgi:anti-sigma regulatory factor (Ser/Thr protein kinase)